MNGSPEDGFGTVPVSLPSQFQDIGYLCHTSDPSGLSIELLQHTFGRQTELTDTSHAHWHLGQVTIRTSDREKSLQVWKAARMRHVATMDVPQPSRGFTLDFVAFVEETPESSHASESESSSADMGIGSVARRLWLWRQPFTQIELQERWTSEHEPRFTYYYTGERRIANGAEWCGLTLIVADAKETAANIRAVTGDSFGVFWSSKQEESDMAGVFAVTVKDADGYHVRLLQAAGCRD
ncbi:MAG: hypothetical protein MHM6MM_006585 [Cercozoa sp. M6MM]